MNNALTVQNERLTVSMKSGLEGRNNEWVKKQKPGAR